MGLLEILGGVAQAGSAGLGAYANYRREQEEKELEAKRLKHQQEREGVEDQRYAQDFNLRAKGQKAEDSHQAALLALQQANADRAGRQFDQQQWGEGGVYGDVPTPSSGKAYDTFPKAVASAAQRATNNSPVVPIQGAHAIYRRPIYNDSAIAAAGIRASVSNGTGTASAFGRAQGNAIRSAQNEAANHLKGLTPIVQGANPAEDARRTAAASAIYQAEYRRVMEDAGFGGAENTAPAYAPSAGRSGVGGAPRQPTGPNSPPPAQDDDDPDALGSITRFMNH